MFQTENSSKNFTALVKFQKDVIMASVENLIKFSLIK
jgi:hypothetical protein